MKSNQDRQLLHELKKTVNEWATTNSQKNQYATRSNADKLRAKTLGVRLSKQLKLHQKNALKPEKLMQVSKQHQEHGVPRRYWALILE